ncbi:hypothetical protein [Cronobacter sakazakii]|uniref:hypothetical protein n=1 Tax=Cronobacter sakazakii TaxID=28141 RepID=UPI000A1DB01C|nr:hypothetical protein [Cronobacter sakazakii]PUY32628.1 hypothetical protein BS421_05405 [Cronobacter sakazakii]
MLDFIRDILASFRQASLERVRSPFLGAFVFSWLGFNWPVLAILFFSKREIEKRLVYIGDNFGIESFIIGPLCTSALIALLLPQINKLVTKIQDKPNTDTVEMSLESKIKIGKKQQEIAEIEARKKLAEKREERYIEESIHNIKTQMEKATSNLNKSTELMNKMGEEITELKGLLSAAESRYTVESEAKKSAQDDLIKERENNRILGDKLTSMKIESDGQNRYIAELLTYDESHVQTIKFLQAKIDRTEAYIDGSVAPYSEIFDVIKNEEAIIISVKNKAKIALTNVNKSLAARNE